MAIMSVGKHEFSIEESYAEIVDRITEACERYMHFVYVTRRKASGEAFNVLVNVHRIDTIAPDFSER